MPEDYDLPEGRWYYRACKWWNRRIPISEEKLERKENILKREYDLALFEKKRAEELMHEIEYIHEPDTKVYKKNQALLRKKEAKLRAIEKSYKKTEFKKAVYFLGLDLDYNEVTNFTLWMTLLSFILLLTVTMVSVILIPEIDMFTLLFFLVLPTLIIPMFLMIFLSQYPMILAKRMKNKLIGRSPEAVNYMIMSLRLNPELTKAIIFAGENTSGPMAMGLKKVIWNVYTRQYNSIEESFLTFAYEWGDWNDDLKRALYAIRVSVLEKTIEGLSRSLEKAKDIILTGTKRKIDDFATSLSGPATVLFALGVLLPLILGAMLPMMSLTNIQLTEQYTSGGISNATGPPPNPGPLILLMDVLFPVLTFGYAYHIIGKRPGTSEPPNIPSPITKKKKQEILLISIIIIIVISSFSIFSWNLPADSPYAIFAALPIILGFAFGVTYYCYVTSYDQKKVRDEIIRMEMEFPDALFQLGSRMAEGIPVETCVIKTADAMKGTAIGELFTRIVYIMRVTGVTLDEALFGLKAGILRDFPSKTIVVTMKTVVEIVKKDPLTAGQTIIEISNYLRDMKKVDHEIKKALGNTISMMRSTAMFFAPAVLGITTTLYIILAKVIPAVSNQPLIPVGVFTLIIGVYLLLMILVIVYFTTGIEGTDDVVGRKWGIATFLSTGALVFSVIAIIAQFTIGNVI